MQYRQILDLLQNFLYSVVVLVEGLSGFLKVIGVEGAFLEIFIAVKPEIFFDRLNRYLQQHFKLLPQVAAYKLHAILNLLFGIPVPWVIPLLDL